MSIARKCNRCQMCFDPEKVTGRICRFHNPVFQDAKSVKDVRNIGFMFEELGPDMWADLCPHCTEEYVEFMKGKISGHDSVPAGIFRKVCEARDLYRNRLDGVKSDLECLVNSLENEEDE